VPRLRRAPPPVRLLLLASWQYRNPEKKKKLKKKKSRKKNNKKKIKKNKALGSGPTRRLCMWLSLLCDVGHPGFGKLTNVGTHHPGERKKKKKLQFLRSSREMADAHPYEVPRAIVARLVKEAVRVPVPHTCHNDSNTTDFKRAALEEPCFPQQQQ
jgi:hypothetical protein